MATVISGNTQISIIQGDSYSKKISFTNIDNSLIKSVYFTCKVLNLKKELVESNGIYFLDFTKEETENYTPVQGNYDLTVEFTDSKINTIVYNSFIEILPKTNTLDIAGE